VTLVDGRGRMNRPLPACSGRFAAIASTNSRVAGDELDRSDGDENGEERIPSVLSPKHHRRFGSLAPFEQPFQEAGAVPQLMLLQRWK
jgi:hypothetical protein